MSCQICNNENDTESFYNNAGSMYDMPYIIINFTNICKSCWSDLALMQSDLTNIAVQYHRRYHDFKNYEHFLKANPQMDDNKFYKQNLIFRNGLPIYVSDRRKEIEYFINKHKT